MTAKATKELGILGGLVIVLGGVLYWNLAPTPATTSPAASSPSVQTTKKPVSSGAVSIDVHLDRLGRRSEASSVVSRDPFRFRPKPSPVKTGTRTPTVVASQPAVTTPPPPPPPPPPAAPPIRYWGYSVSPTGRAIASLSYGAPNSNVVQLVGVEGDVIEGRFRLQRIEPNAIEVVELNGNRRTRIPRL